MKNKFKRKQGQAMVEYIIIVAVVAIAALVVFGLFGDVIQEKVAGAATALDSDSTAQDHVQEGNSLNSLKSLESDGTSSGDQ